jgi:Niemann-Pick C1 protein
MGSNVIVGIATTKFLGVLILVFAPSELFKIYYFRMYLMIIALGIFQGLFAMPLFLYYFGPSKPSKIKSDHLFPLDSSSLRQ